MIDCSVCLGRECQQRERAELNPVGRGRTCFSWTKRGKAKWLLPAALSVLDARSVDF